MLKSRCIDYAIATFQKCYPPTLTPGKTTIDYILRFFFGSFSCVWVSLVVMQSNRFGLPFYNGMLLYHNWYKFFSTSSPLVIKI